MGVLYLRMPTAYLPDEDQGILLAQVIMPKGATLEQTGKVTEQIQRYFQEKEKEAVESCMTIAGIGFSGRAQNNGMVFVKLKDWELRDRADLKAKAIAGRAMAALSSIRNAMVFAFPPPAVVELGTAKGFDFQLLDRGGLGHAALMAAQKPASRDRGQGPAADRGSAQQHGGCARIPDRRGLGKGRRPGGPHHLHPPDHLGGLRQRLCQRLHPGRPGQAGVRPGRRPLPHAAQGPGKTLCPEYGGEDGPLFLLRLRPLDVRLPQLARFNGFPSMNIWGEPAPGRSSGEAMQAMEEAVAKLPKGIGFDWTGLSYQERMSSSQAPLLYAFSIFVIFLCLAALYESWPIPISILLVLPLGVIGGVIASSLRGLANDVYFQIGLLTTLGLTTKNAILIVQFAKAGVEKGMGLIEATLEGAKLRFRPIVMTSLAFGFGVLPLALTTGAGAGAQNAIGTGVLGGMVTATVLVVIFCAPLLRADRKDLRQTQEG